MRGLQRARWVVGAATFAMIATACGGGNEPAGGGAAAPTSGAAASSGAASGGGGGSANGAIVIDGTEPENPLIPAKTTETGGGKVVDSLFTGLIEYNPDTAEGELAVAESITASPDNRKYTIKLKPGWTFHDGTPVNAKSFVDAWNWSADGRNANQSAYFFEPIAGYADIAGTDENGDGTLEEQPKSDKLSGLRLVDDSTFEVTLSSPSSTFQQRLGYTAFSPLPESFFKDPKAFGEAPVGNGPFKLVRWNHNADIAITAFENYQGDEKAKVKDVTFKLYQSQDAAYADLQGDVLDFQRVLPTSATAGDKYRTDLDGRFIDKEIGAIQTIVLPQYVKEYKNPNLGKALSMAIDRELIIKNALPGRVPATGWVAPAVIGYKPGAAGEFTQFNPTRAKELLQQAGGFDGTLTIAYNADGDHKTWVDATCVSIKNALGVECQGKPYTDFSALRKDANAKKMTGMIRAGWQMDYPHIENFLAPLYATGASSNDGSYSNKRFDALLKEAASLKGDAALAKFQEAEALLINDFPVIPLYYYRTQSGYSTKVDNVKVTPFGELDLSSITVKQ